MTPILFKAATAVAAVAGLAFTSMDGAGPAYSADRLTALTRADIETHAARVFDRADQNGDNILNVDEFTTLSIVTVELARLNGFITVETGDAPGIVELPGALPAALPASEHIRVAAVSQTAFYVFAGSDGLMSPDEFTAAQTAMFDAADLNHNKKLMRQELTIFAQNQASLTIGA